MQIPYERKRMWHFGSDFELGTSSDYSYQNASVKEFYDYSYVFSGIIVDTKQIFTMSALHCNV